MMKFHPFFFLLLSFVCTPDLFAQEKLSLQYYLPQNSYNPAIPTPAQWLGYEVGEWHASHDQLLGYMKVLDAASDRISMQVYGYSHEHRPLVCLTITAPQNHARLSDIQAQRQALVNPGLSAPKNMRELPAVNYMGYSIHGNETSGSNAAFLVAYHLAAAQSTDIQELLNNTIILLDPCFNPDGMQRFSSWVNSHKSQNPSPNPAGDEYHEPWPGGRTNHYGFDLNRDWLVLQQPESEGRVAIFQAWHPNVLTDHHEMGSGSSFFFQPGVPTRVNPITPAQNQVLTAKIGDYHARLLSQNKVLFFTGERYDDFYYGKGSTYPDVQGCIGILFEQASSRGTMQQTSNGLLTFPYSIRNQVFTSLSTLQAVQEMRVELNEYLRNFFVSALEEGRNSEVKGYIFSCNDAPARELLDVLRQHRISAQSIAENVKMNGLNFQKDEAYFVPCNQAQYRLVRGIFERNTQFPDSIFYDISAWTLPDAFGLQWAEIRGNTPKISKEDPPNPTAQSAPHLGGPAYAYVLPASGYTLPKTLVKIHQAGLRVRVAMEPFVADNQSFNAGSLLIAADRQPMSAATFVDKINQLSLEGNTFFPVENGLTPQGPDLGSQHFPVLKMPNVLLLTGSGVNVGASGEIWHLLDTRYHLPITLVETERLGSLDLGAYQVLILPDGNYGNISVEKVKQFVLAGGTVIATGMALKWLKTNGLVPLEFRELPVQATGRRPYGNIAGDLGARHMPGAIFEAELDLTHPLCFGYERSHLPVFLSEALFVETTKNPYASPAVLTQSPLLAGYIHPQQKPFAAGAAAAVVSGLGRGKIICFPGNPNFRGFWYGTNRMFANAVFFGNLISRDGLE